MAYNKKIPKENDDVLNFISNQEDRIEESFNELAGNSLESYEDLNNRIDNIIATPTTVSEQEIIDARDGLPSLGAKIRELDKSKLGYKRFYNILKNNQFEGITYWSSVLANTTTNNNIATLIPTAKLGQIRQSLGSSSNERLVYFSIMVKSLSKDLWVDVRDSGGYRLFGKKTSGSGEWERVSILGVVPANEPPQVRVIDYEDNSWKSTDLQKGIVIDLTSYGESISISTLESMIRRNNNNDIYFTERVNSDFIDGILNDTEHIEKGYYYISADHNSIRIASNYSPTKDLIIELSKRGPNSIFDFKNFYLNENTEIFPLENIDGTLLGTVSSDYFGPYIVSAKNNINGDDVDNKFFTGGNHGYDNTGSLSNNSATGRTKNIVIHINDKQVNHYDGYCNKVKITWDNFIQGYNTRKQDGSGREILKETYTLEFIGGKIYVHNEITALEDIYIERYYGIQAQKNIWGDVVTYIGGSNRKTTSGSSTSLNKNTSIIRLGDEYKIDMFVDKTYDLGMLEFSDRTYNAFSSKNKTYFYLINNGLELDKDEKAYYKGYYKFYHKED